MHFVPHLRRSLKSDEIVELLELWDADVIYKFDRTHENMPDEYWAGLYTRGVNLLFDENQILKCIFLYILEAEGFSPVDLSDSDIQVFGSPEEVAAYAAGRGLPTSVGRAGFQGVMRDWIRVEWSTHSIHYEFRNGALGLIAVTRA
jgi:hypothetical protein